jgi:hypothetical protein
LGNSNFPENGQLDEFLRLFAEAEEELVNAVPKAEYQDLTTKILLFFKRQNSNLSICNTTLS